MKNILKTIFLFSFTTILAQVSVVKESPFSSYYLGVPIYPKESVDYRAFLGEYNVWNNKAFYIADYYFQPCKSGCKTLNLVMTDGTENGTVVLKNLISSTVSNPIAIQFKPAGNYIYFTIQYTDSASNIFLELWRTDGTAAGTFRVDQVQNPVSPQKRFFSIEIGGDEYNGNRGPRYKTDSHIGNTFYYLKYSTAQRKWEIWKTDGSQIQAVTNSPLIDLVNDTGYLTSYNNKLYLLDKNYNLVSYDGSVFSNVIPFTIGDTGGGGQGVVTRVYQIGTIFKDKLYIGARINNISGIFSLDSQNISQFIFKKDASSIGFDFMKTKDHLVFVSSGATSEVILTNGIPGNSNRIFYQPNTTTIIKQMFTDNDNIFFITRPYDTSQMMNGKIYRANSDGSNLTSVNCNLEYALDRYENYKIYKNTLWFNYRLPDAPNSVGEELWRTDGIGLSQAFDQYTEIFGGYNGSFGASYFFKLNDEMYFFGLKNSSTNALYRLKGDFTFNNSQNDSKWSNAGNWNVGLTPLTQNDAIIPSGFTPNVDADAFAKNLSVASPLNLSSGSLYITGNLELNSKISLNNNAVNLKGTSSNITGGNATNYIVTNGTGSVNVENLNSARGTVNLPIGTATNYNPVSIANTGTSDTFSARVSDGISNTTNGAVNATWEISEATAGGSNVSLTLGWNASQQNAAFDSGTAKVGHYLNGNWTEENSGAISNNSITATGISSFSPFAVMNFGALAASDFSKSKVLIYPNPFNENLNISTENGGVVYFYDLSGKLVSTSILMKGTNSLNKSSLAKGVYIYQIRNTIGEILSSGKVIKK
jgi:hypothetical protein